MSGLNRFGIRGIVVQSILIIVGFAVLFISAGTIAWIRAWIYIGLVSIYWVISTVMLARMNPEMLNERGSVVKKGTQGFDKVWLAIIPVLTFGPYKIIRHPGYAGLIVSILSYPFILGSWWGFVPSGILTIIIVIRTVLEDNMLQNKLQGYKEYASKVKYRLIPLIW